MKRSLNNGSAKKKQTLVRIPVTIRMPEAVIRQIDDELDHRDIPVSRNNWLLEAAIEKLKRAGQGGVNGAK